MNILSNNTHKNNTHKIDQRSLGSLGDSKAGLICVPYMYAYVYALYVCLICMPYMYAVYVCLMRMPMCMPYMYALYVQYTHQGDREAGSAHKEHILAIECVLLLQNVFSCCTRVIERPAVLTKSTSLRCSTDTANTPLKLSPHAAIATTGAA